jgi:hypothetical protein
MQPYEGQLCRGWWSDRLEAWSDRPRWWHEGNPGYPTQVEPLMSEAKPHVGDGSRLVYLCYNTFC